MNNVEQLLKISANFIQTNSQLTAAKLMIMEVLNNSDVPLTGNEMVELRQIALQLEMMINRTDEKSCAKYIHKFILKN